MLGSAIDGAAVLRGVPSPAAILLLLPPLLHLQLQLSLGIHVVKLLLALRHLVCNRLAVDLVVLLQHCRSPALLLHSCGTLIGGLHAVVQRGGPLGSCAEVSDFLQILCPSLPFLLHLLPPQLLLHLSLLLLAMMDVFPLGILFLQKGAKLLTALSVLFLPLPLPFSSVSPDGFMLCHEHCLMRVRIYLLLTHLLEARAVASHPSSAASQSVCHCPLYRWQRGQGRLGGRDTARLGL
mmetsp:Transcript_10121/g.29087  ORF Transcript_10121/g.29087 Transcript_10121/m.29087 type:complete len:237 (+) Transcript_10121:1024-1734(+)